MMNEKEKICVKGVLELMQEEEVRNLAQTVTNNLIVIENSEGKLNVLRKFLSGCVNLENAIRTEKLQGVGSIMKKNRPAAG